MSKAFTRESDDAPDDSLSARPLSAILGGLPNYLTPRGAQRLRAELGKLLRQPDPRASSNATGTPGSRVTRLRQILATATVVPAPPDPAKIAFGARVRARNQRGEVPVYWIVGVEETDLDEDAISWQSPLAKALLGARVGSRVRTRLPAGEEEFEILEISYPGTE